MSDAIEMALNDPRRLGRRLEEEKVEVGSDEDLTEKRRSYNATRSVSALLMSYDDGVMFKCMRGPVGNGKSVGICMYIVHKAQQQEVMEVVEHGRRFKVRWSKCLFMRHSVKASKETQITTWNQWFGDKTRWVSDPYEGRYEDVGPDGVLVRIDIIVLGAKAENVMDDLQSLELSMAWVNEAPQCPYKVVSRVYTRLKRFNPCPSSGVMLRWFHVVMDTNSPNETSWWRRKEEVEKPRGWLFIVCPPAVLEERDPVSGAVSYVPNDPEHAAKHHRRPAENVRTIDGGFHPDMTYWTDMLSVLEEDEIRTLLMNQFGLSMGGLGVFSDVWNAARHKIPAEQAQYMRGMRVVGGMDCGRTPACLIGQMRPDGKLVAQREATTWNPKLNNGRGGLDRMDVVQFFDTRLRPILVNYYDWPNCELTIFADPAGRNFNEVVSLSAIQRLRNERGVNVVSCDKVQPMNSAEMDITHGNSPEIRIACVKRELRLGSFLVSEECQMFLEAMAGRYCFPVVRSRSGDGAERYGDAPEKNEWSHIADGGQYMCLAVFKGAEDYSRPSARRLAADYRSLVGNGMINSASL